MAELRPPRAPRRARGGHACPTPTPPRTTSPLRESLCHVPAPTRPVDLRVSAATSGWSAVGMRSCAAAAAPLSCSEAGAQVRPVAPWRESRRRVAEREEGSSARRERTSLCVFQMCCTRMPCGGAMSLDATACLGRTRALAPRRASLAGGRARATWGRSVAEGRSDPTRGGNDPREGRRRQVREAGTAAQGRGADVLEAAKGSTHPTVRFLSLSAVSFQCALLRYMWAAVDPPCPCRPRGTASLGTLGRGGDGRARGKDMTKRRLLVRATSGRPGSCATVSGP